MQDSLALSKSISLQVSLCSDANVSEIDEDLIKPTSKKVGSQRIISSEENSPVILAANTLSDVLDEDRNSQGNILFLNDTGKSDYYCHYLTFLLIRQQTPAQSYTESCVLTNFLELVFINFRFRFRSGAS